MFSTEQITRRCLMTLSDGSKIQATITIPKPFDRVITRTPDTPWTANFFSHIDSDGVKNCIDDKYLMCLPYNEETAKLIGTTNNWEG